MIKVEFRCGGCDAVAYGKIRKTFYSFNGRGYGFGTYRETTAQEAAPEGWIAFDPYTEVTYCPVCWESIESGEAGQAVVGNNPGLPVELDDDPA